MSPRASERATRRHDPRRRRIRHPPGHDAPHVRGCGGVVRLQPPGEGRVRGDRADAGGADLRRAAARVVGRRARAHGFHRPLAPRPRAALARARGARGVRRHAVPPHLADVAQGRPDLGLPRRDRCAAHRVRSVRLLHGGHDRARGADSPLQGYGAPMTEGLIGLTVMMLLAFLRVPIAYAMGLVGVVGYAYMRDWSWAVAFAMAQTKLYETGRSYTLSVVPLFILMGNFVTRAGMSRELFRAAYAFIGHLRGGLAMATVWASAGFGGICGSSIATAATMAKVAYPSMKRFGYSDKLAAGTRAPARPPGIMIPPPPIMGIYGIFTQTHIRKLFMAGSPPRLLS